MYFCFSVDYAFVSRIALHQYFLNSREDSHVNSFAFVFPFQKFCGVGFKLAVMPSINFCPLNISESFLTFSFAEDIKKAVGNHSSDCRLRFATPN